MIYLGAVDGTHDKPDEEYKKDFANSFVRRLANMAGSGGLWTEAFYHRGPYNFGTDTAVFARIVHDKLVEKWKTGEARAIFLTGYSRGGAAVIEIAKWLKEEENIPVECLILFDPVDRTTTVGGWIYNTPIPSTVKRVIYAQRDVQRTLSRISFGHCGLTKENPALSLTPQKFFATHGGLGGVPWDKAVDPILGTPIPYIYEIPELNPTRVTPAMDIAGSRVVWASIFAQTVNARHACQYELDNPPSKPFQPMPMPNPIPSKPFQPMPIPNPLKPKRTHTVVQGDWLSKIAVTYYGDMNKWTIIYEANKPVIGSNPNLIKPGMQLVIP